MLFNLLHNADVDSLEVFVQNRNGMPASLRRLSAFAAFGVGENPIWRVPDKSIRIAEMAGRLKAMMNLIKS